MPAATGEPQGAGPEMVAQYRLDAVIARGGLATVCRATDTTLGRTVALKIIDDGARAPALIAEARNTSRLSHPGIAQVHQAGIDPATGLAFIALEWVPGPTLREIVRRGPLPLADLYRHGQDIAAAVAAAHAAGLVHGDLKADNVVIAGEPGRAKLLDFGLSVPDEQIGQGELWGTPAAMAPELLAGGPRTAQSDLFALGVLLFELATGKLPFGGETGDDEEVRRRQEERAPDPRALRLELPGDIAETIRTLLARDPASRGPGAIEVARLLRLRRRALEGRRPVALPLLLIAALAAAGAWHFRHELGLAPPAGAGAGRGAREAAAAPHLSVGRWGDPAGAETAASRVLADLLALLLAAEDPGSALLAAPSAPLLSGTVEATGGGAAEWVARWRSPTGVGEREERAAGALPLARRVAERAIRDGAANSLAEIEAPEEAILVFAEAVRLAERGDLEEARQRFARARERAGAFPDAAAWEAALRVVLGRPGEARTLLPPLRGRPSQPARALLAALDVPAGARSERWGRDHRLARLFDLALARRDPLATDEALAAAIEAERGAGLAWIAEERVSLALRRGDPRATAEALERYRTLAPAASPALWRLEHAAALAGDDREEAMETFLLRLFELPGSDPRARLRIPFLLQRERLGPAADEAESAAALGEDALPAALVLAAAGRWEAALARSRAIDEPFDPSLPSRVRAAVESLRGDRAAAARALAEARPIDPGRPETAILARLVEGNPFEFSFPEGEAPPPGTALARFAAPFLSLGAARRLRVGGDPAGALRTLDGIRFVADDLSVHPWPETVYLAWLERIVALADLGRAEEARAAWRGFRRWWPEDRPAEALVSRTAAEVGASLERGGGGE